MDPSNPEEPQSRDPEMQAHEQSELDYQIAQFTGMPVGTVQPQEPVATTSESPSWWETVKATYLNAPFARAVIGEHAPEGVQQVANLRQRVAATGSSLDQSLAQSIASQVASENKNAFLESLRDMPEDERSVAVQMHGAGLISPLANEYEIRSHVADYKDVLKNQETLDLAWRGSGFKAFTASMVAGIADPAMIAINTVLPGAEGLTVAMPTLSATRVLATKGLQSAVAFGSANLIQHKIAGQMNYGITDPDGISDDLMVFGTGAGFGLVMPWSGYVARYGIAKLIDSMPNSAVLPASVRGWSFMFDRTGANREAVKDLLYARLPNMGSEQPQGISYSRIQNGNMRTPARSALDNIGRETANEPQSSVPKAFFQQHEETVQMLDNLIASAERGVFYEDMHLITLSRLDNDAVQTRLARLNELYDARAESIRSQWKAYDQAREVELNARAAGATPTEIAPPDMARNSAPGLRIRVFEHNDQARFDNLIRAYQVLSNDKLANSIIRRWSANGLLADVSGSPLAIGSTPANRLRNAPGWYGDVLDLIAGVPEARAHDMDPSAPVRVSAEARKDAMAGQVNNLNHDIAGILNEVRGRGTVLGQVNERGSRVQQEAIDILIDRANESRGGVPGAQRNPFDNMGLTQAEIAELHAAAKRIADRLETHFREVGQRAVDAGLMPKEALDNGTYLPVMLNRAKIIQNQAEFEEALVRQFQLKDAEEGRVTAVDSNGNTEVSDPFVRRDALRQAWEDASRGNKGLRRRMQNYFRNHLGNNNLVLRSGDNLDEALLQTRTIDVNGIQAEAPHSLPTVTEFANAHPDIQEAYYAALNRIHRASAREIMLDVTNPVHNEVTVSGRGAVTAKPFRERRVFDFISDEIRQYLNRDLDQIIRRYAAATHGEIAMADTMRANPEVFGRLRTSAGEPVQTASDLLDWLNASRRAIGEMLGQEGGQGTTLSGEAPLTRRQQENINAMVNGNHDDIRVLLKRLIDQTPYDHGITPERQLFASNVLNRLTVLRAGGMIGITNVLHLANMLFRAYDSPMRFTSSLYRSMAGMTTATRRDLQYMGMLFQHGRLNMEMDSSLSGLGNEGVGTGLTRDLTTGVDRATNAISHRFADLNLTNLIHDVSKRAAAIMAIGDCTEWSKVLLQAVRKVGNVDDGDAIRKAFVELGGKDYQLGRLSKMGIKAGNVEQFLQATHTHGLMWDGATPISRRMTFDEFIADRGPNTTVVNPNFNDWDPVHGEFLKDFIPAVTNEARRSYLVTPGIADRPVSLDQYPLLRSVNMFYSYLLASGPQRARLISEMPIAMQGRAIAGAVFTGWIHHAVMNELTGRRSFADSVHEVYENPSSAVYEGLMGSAYLGSLSRTLGWMDTMGVGPGTALGTQFTPGTAAFYQREMRFGVKPPEVFNYKPFIGAPFNYVDDVLRAASAGAHSLKTGAPPSDQQQYLKASLMPLQNFWATRMLNWGTNKAFGEPIGRTLGENFSPYFSLSSDAMRPPPRPQRGIR